MTEPNYKIYDCEDWIVVHNLEKSELLMIDRNYLIITMSDISILGTLDISNVYSSHGLVGILQLGQCECLIFIKACQRVGDIGSKAIFSVSEVEVLTINNKCEFPNFITAIRNLFSNGFYFSHNFDLTSSLETQKNAKIQQDSYYDIILHSDKSFLWNCNLIKKLLDFKIGSNYVVNLIQGFVGFISEELTINNESVKLNYILISRRQIDNAGLFSFKKGVDINGHVANFVETEQIAIIAKNIFSFVQHRGTAPIDYNLNYMDSMNKFQKHINNICQKYKLLFLINLMNSENNEQNLTDHFENLIQEANNKNVKYSYFDYDKETSLNCNSIEDFLNRMESILSIFKFFAIINQGNSDESIITKSIEQIGVIRTNCYDALDRTNKIQMNIAWKILIKQLNMTNVDAKVISNDKLKFTNRVDIFFDENLSTDTFMDKFIDLWETNNTRLKEFYLGNNSSLDIFPIENGIVSPTDQILLQKCIDLINKWEINTKSN